ncbi:MAG: HDOD domain-containing protein [Nitrospiraceae bacterium]|nr:HDOD domain-containing protein [Nitrospiraceae bacterium]
MQTEILAKVQEIPPLSASASELIMLMGKANHDLKHIVSIVECDAGLTSRVLRVVNSPAFYLLAPTTSIVRAVSYLGEKAVLEIALEACMGSILRRPLKGYEGKSDALWEHNLRTAIASREVAKFAKKEISLEIAFTGGILHDIGKAVLSEFLKGSAEDIISKIDAGDAMDYVSAEHEMLGTDHSVVGYEVARLWKLAFPLPEIIRFHHTPDKAKEEVRGLVYAVHLGDIIAMMGGTGTGSDDMLYHLDSGFSDYIQISQGDFEKIMLDVEVEFKKTKLSIFGRENTAL